MVVSRNGDYRLVICDSVAPLRLPSLSRTKNRGGRLVHQPEGSSSGASALQELREPGRWRILFEFATGAVRGVFSQPARKPNNAQRTEARGGSVERVQRASGAFPAGLKISPYLVGIVISANQDQFARHLRKGNSGIFRREHAGGWRRKFGVEKVANTG
jgi:hypothetical protein